MRLLMRLLHARTTPTPPTACASRGASNDASTRREYHRRRKIPHAPPNVRRTSRDLAKEKRRRRRRLGFPPVAFRKLHAGRVRSWFPLRGTVRRSLSYLCFVLFRTGRSLIKETPTEISTEIFPTIPGTGWYPRHIYRTYIVCASWHLRQLKQ